ncbi:MAG: adenosine deaminase [Bdellovibrionota bacterium]
MGQVELHRHLDISIRTRTLLQLAQKRGLEPQSTSIASFTDKFILRKPLRDLNAVLAKFKIFQKILDRPEVLATVAFEAVEDCRAEGITQVELRFSPSFVCELNSMSWEDALSGFESGIRRALESYPEINVGLICIASREYGAQVASDLVDFFLRNRNRFIGIDLAGNESDFPCRLFEEPFKKASKHGAKITVHAGEASGPESMWEAIDLLGATRIGHGIACVKDGALMKYLAENKICLEMCPTSNWITGAVESLQAHPLPIALRAGVPVCINTDDPGIFGVTLSHEAGLCENLMGLSKKEIELCQEHARAASFIHKA